MIKKLDRLILRSFIGPFIATFFITLFVLVMQFFWKYIDDLVGKGLGLGYIAELTIYVSTTVIPYALPISILISSIMTFGNFGESFELVAIKSSGISLMRFMRPVLIISFVLSMIAFLIANYVMPVANLKFATMLYDIRVAKPALDIKEGIFYDKIPGYAIKIGEKDKDGNGIKNIIIFENQFVLQDNIIIAEKGSMHISDDKKFLEFDLENGWRYQEKGSYNTTATDFYRLGFKKYKKVFDLSSFNMMKTPDSLLKGSYNMLNVEQLNHSTDSIRKILTDIKYKRIPKEVNTYFVSAPIFMKGTDTIVRATTTVTSKAKSYAALLPDSVKTMSYSKAADKINLIKNALDLIAYEDKQRQNDMLMYHIAWHKKFAFSFACIVLFLIGAPLGAIIRKGGLGMPLVVAVVFFLLFHLLNVFGEKFVRQELMSPFWGIWLSSLALLPVGIFLVVKAMNDSQLFNNEFYFRFFKSIKSYFTKKQYIIPIN
ncbi:MAG: YjgP/YjgQ family permease [Bacteroidetes bacterium]|nr:YjgP/YjgQ family permease [Bacteroidota bacterium]